MGDAEASSSVTVLCRFRPYNDREKRLGLDGAKDFLRIEHSSVSVQEDGEARQFHLARCLGMDTTQEQLFNESVSGAMVDYFKGFNVTVFAYGQTGAGKSFSMFGDLKSDEMKGLVPRCCEMVFGTVKALHKIEFSLSCSYCEIYQEKVGDLLDPNKQNLDLRESASKGIYVSGLTWKYVTGASEVYSLISLGDAHKVRRATKMNPNSSRSHCNFCLRLEKKSTENGSTTETLLNLVDLAGSERIAKTGAEGKALEEAKKINLSLTTLAQCIKALTDGHASHVPYRQSKLTRLLQDSLGGNSKTTMLVACSPHPNNCEETINSLRFAERCANVKNRPKVNVKLSVAELEATIAALREQLAKAKSKSGYSRAQMLDQAIQTDGDNEKFQRIADAVMEAHVEIDLKQVRVATMQHARQEVLHEIQRTQLEMDAIAERVAKEQVDAPRRRASQFHRISTDQRLKEVDVGGALYTPVAEADEEGDGAPPSSSRASAPSAPVPEVAGVPPARVEAMRRVSVQAQLAFMDDVREWAPQRVQNQLVMFSPEPSGLSPDQVGSMSQAEKVQALERIRDLHEKVNSAPPPASKSQQGPLSVAGAGAGAGAGSSKTQQKIGKYEEKLGLLEEELRHEADERERLELRLNDQEDIMERQQVAKEDLELQFDDLFDERAVVEEELANVRTQVDRLQEEVDKVQDQIRRQKEAIRSREEAERKAAEEAAAAAAAAEESVVSGALNFVTGGLFSKMW